MQSETPKQFMKIGGHEVLWYSLKAMEESCVTDVVVVTSAEYVEYVKRRYLEAGAGADTEDSNLVSSSVDGMSFKKLRAVVAGGDERYDSVYEGLQAICGLRKGSQEHHCSGNIVIIHDGDVA